VYGYPKREAAEVAVAACASADDLDVVFCGFDPETTALHQAAIERRTAA
jgi:hypothetical protein